MPSAIARSDADTVGNSTISGHLSTSRCGDRNADCHALTHTGCDACTVDKHVTRSTAHGDPNS
jgi:hypothetical protein